MNGMNEKKRLVTCGTVRVDYLGQQERLLDDD